MWRNTCSHSTTLCSAAMEHPAGPNCLQKVINTRNRASPTQNYTTDYTRFTQHFQNMHVSRARTGRPPLNDLLVLLRSSVESPFLLPPLNTIIIG